MGRKWWKRTAQSLEQELRDEITRGEITYDLVTTSVGCDVKIHFPKGDCQWHDLVDALQNFAPSVIAQLRAAGLNCGALSVEFHKAAGVGTIAAAIPTEQRWLAERILDAWTNGGYSDPSLNLF